MMQYKVATLPRDEVVLCRVGKHYPTRLHSRDASFPEFRTDEPDPNLLCGALVSGPYAPGKGGDDGPVSKGALARHPPAVRARYRAMCPGYNAHCFARTTFQYSIAFARLL